MIGLSITAIGLRSITECLDIFHALCQPMRLNYLELAIGSNCPVDFDYSSVTLVLHHSCLYRDNLRLRLDPLNQKTWHAYSDFIASHDVRAVSIHPPLQRECTRRELETALSKLQKALNVPIYLEVMPFEEYWCSSLKTLVDHPLLLDVSHVLIWFGGDQELTRKTCLELLIDRVGKIHLSHNNGRSDAHELIPSDVWFNNFIESWSHKYFVTFESLSIEYSAYERLDKRRKRKKNQY